MQKKIWNKIFFIVQLPVNIFIEVDLATDKSLFDI